MNHKLESRFPGEIRYTGNTTLMGESEEELKSLLIEVKEESEKVSLKLNLQYRKIKASSAITSWKIDVEKMITRICLQCERPGFDLWVGKIPWRRERLSIPVFWPIQNIVHEVTESQTRLSGFPFQQTLFYWALKSLQVVTAAMKLKDTCFLEEKL